MNWLEIIGFIHVVFYALVGLSYIYSRALKNEKLPKMEIFQTEVRNEDLESVFGHGRSIHTVKKEL